MKNKNNKKIFLEDIQEQHLSRLSKSSDIKPSNSCTSAGGGNCGTGCGGGGGGGFSLPRR